MIYSYVRHAGILKNSIFEIEARLSSLKERYGIFKETQSNLISKNIFFKLDSLFNKLFKAQHVYLKNNIRISIDKFENLIESWKFLDSQRKIKELKNNHHLLRENLNKLGTSFIEKNPLHSINSKNSVLNSSDWFEIIEDLKKDILSEQNKEIYELIWNKLRIIIENLNVKSNNKDSIKYGLNNEISAVDREEQNDEKLLLKNSDKPKGSVNSSLDKTMKYSVDPKINKKPEDDKEFDNYEYYFSLNQRELDRMKRSGKYRKKSSKSKYN